MIFGLFGKKEDRATLATPTTWLFNSLTGGTTPAGISVNATTALNYSAVYAAVRLISESVASLPLHTYERLPDGKRRTREHDVAKLLAISPNRRMTSFTFRETIMGHVLTWGNGYAEIVRDGSGNPVELLPITPDRMRVEQDSDGTVRYIVDENITLMADDVFHIAGLGFDGLIGYSPITLAKNCIGLGLAAERFGSSFFSNSARPAGVLSHPNRLSQEAAGRLKDTWQQTYGGSSNVGKTAILEEGMAWQNIGVSNNDAEFLATRKFQITEVARWYNVPPHKIGDLDKATFSNIEHQAIEYVTYTLRPWLVRFETEVSRKLFRNDEPLFSEFQVDGLLRGDTKTRYDSYKIAKETGWLSVNEIRALENLNPVDGGDAFTQPMNMDTVGSDEPDPTEVEQDEGRAWARPLLEDALARAKRLQLNAERNALKRKGDYYGEWRTKWASDDLPPLFMEIIDPVLGAIATELGWTDEKYSDRLATVSEKWIESDKPVEIFTDEVLGGIQ
tara:strand:+ start:2038 stop:3552 length:1515 start_codon:yes stop_codon:yes gene_type:complete